MGSATEKKLHEAGWLTGDVVDFLGMSEQQRVILDTRVAMAKAVRAARKAQKLTQQELARRIKSTQPRVAKLEVAAADVSLDQMYHALVALGGDIRVVSKPRGSKSSAPGVRKKPAKRGSMSKMG